MACATLQPRFVFEDTRHKDYRYIREGLIRRGWRQEILTRRQEVCPAARSARDTKCFSSWGRRGDATGKASTSHTHVSCPDLIWTLSSKHSPASCTWGEQQATNIFRRSSCLTTKAGLCRTLRSIKYGCSEIGEEIGSPWSFFPRCFDLSDSSQLDEFKENFRQTAAASILKVICRLWPASSTSATPGPSPDDACRCDSDKADASCRYLKGRNAGGCNVVGDCSGDVHLWMLALTVRGCRRRLLEMSGWRDNFAETRRDTNGVEALSDGEWESLLLYSYILRGVAHASSGTTADTCCTSSKALLDEAEIPHAVQESKEMKFEETSLGYSNVGHDACHESHAGGRVHVGLRGLQGLHDTSTSCSRKEIDNLARRPSSAPAGQCFGDEQSEGRHCLSVHRATKAREHRFYGGCGKSTFTTHRTTPGEWTPEELRHLQRGLATIWGASESASSTSSRCSRETRRGDGVFHGFLRRKRHNYGQLWVEAAQLCAALERRCPQWGMDGECNLWMLKPAGASKGRGVRVAWTLEQILHAQQTMGGRVVQKYVETPMLLPRCWRYPQLPESPARVRKGQHFRRHLQRRCRVKAGAETPWFESCMRTQGHKGKGGSRVSEADKATEAEKRKAECSVGLDVVNSTQQLLENETASPSRRSAHRLEDHKLRCPKDTARTGITLREPSVARKFDIRVWVLVTGWTPLEAFVFDECYLRVCPQSFTLAESNFANPGVHITNLSARRPSSASIGANRAATEKDECVGGRPNDAQTREQPGDERDAHLHDERDRGERNIEGVVASQAELILRLGEMERVEGKRWSAGKGEGELRARGERLWRNKVFPSIEGVVRSTLLAAQSFVKPRALSFQLFGFDLHLDRDLNPWLLEVNQSPALSHSSKRQTALIRSMCEGLLRRTVDLNFEAPLSSPSKTGTDDEIYYSDATERVGDPPPERHCLGKWKPISTTSCDHMSWPQASTKTSNASIRSLGSEAFSIQGQHLTKKGVARAERGIRIATAVKVLVVWWRSMVEKCRVSRLRRSHAVAAICKWVALLYPQRRLRAVMTTHSKSARIIQTNWRRASARVSESRRFVVHVAACVTLQMMWKRWKLHCRCESRLLRRMVFSGLKGWATVVLSRRRNMARGAIHRVVVLTMTRRRKKRDAAARIIRRLNSACNRRRQGRLLLQRFARMCLAHWRLAARSRARILRLQTGAATIIRRSLRKAMAHSAFARAVLTLQRLYRKVQYRRKRLHSPTAIIQRAWRHSKQRRLLRTPSRPRLAVATRAVSERAARGFVDANFSGTSAPEFVLDLSALVIDDQSSPAPSDVATHDLSERGDTPISGSQASGDHTPAGTSLPLHRHTFTLTCRTEEGFMIRGSLSSKREEEASPISFDYPPSPATTTREDWIAPDRNPTEETAETRYSHNAEDHSLSCHEKGRAAVDRVQTPGPGTVLFQRSNGCQRPSRSKTGVDQEKGGAMEEGDYREGLLKLEDILPDLTKDRRKRAVLEIKKCRGRSQSLDQHRPSNRCQRQMADAGESWGVRVRPTGPPSYELGKTVPSPPARVLQQLIPRDRTHRVCLRGRAGSRPASPTSRRHKGCRCKEVRDGGRPPFRFGVRSQIMKNDNEWEGTPEAVRAPSCGMRAISSLKLRTCARKTKTKRRVGIQDEIRPRLRSLDTTNIFQRGGERGSRVLEVLALLEA